MKKKTKIIILIVILILLIPIPNGAVKDGGTKQFTALTYKVVKWNRLVDADNIYSATEFYAFPYNFMSLDRLWESKTDRYMPKSTEENICNLDHSPAEREQYCDDPYTGGWCGNTQTTITVEGKEYSFMYGDSVNLTSFYTNHSFKDNHCKCDEGIHIQTEMGSFTVNLEKYFARNGNGQAQLTLQQTEEIKEIIERQTAG